MAADPLFETLFRATAPRVAGGASLASAAPVRVRGTRSRAGNAMQRTRAALLDGAREAVAASGSRITMAQVAACAGVAKATLYNHFRTREAVLGALLLREVEQVVAAVEGRELAEALRLAGEAISCHPLVRALAELDPAALVELARIDSRAEGWRIARAAVATALSAHGRDGADTVLRLFAGYLLSPRGAAGVAADVSALLEGLPSGATARRQPA